MWCRPHAGTVDTMGGPVIRWGRSRDGRRHLVQTLPEHLGRPGVTAVSMCGASLETVVRPGVAWGGSPGLLCGWCMDTLAERVVVVAAD